MDVLPRLAHLGVVGAGMNQDDYKAIREALFAFDAEVKLAASRGFKANAMGYVFSEIDMNIASAAIAALEKYRPKDEK